MDIYEKLKAWLAEQKIDCRVDRCGQKLGAAGLYPLGVEELSTREDVTGNRYRQVRYRFLLRLIAPPGETMAQRLLQLQLAAPAGGFTATEGSMKKPGSDGLAIYEIRLSAEREEKV